MGAGEFRNGIVCVYVCGGGGGGGGRGGGVDFIFHKFFIFYTES